MEYYEKRSYVSIAILAVVYAVAFWHVAQTPLLWSGGEQALAHWGSIFLAVFLALVILTIVCFSILHAVHVRKTGEKPTRFVDERDQTIEHRAVTVGYYSFVLCVFLTIVAMMVVPNSTLLFIGLLVSFMVTGLVSDVMRIVLYRKGRL